MVKGTEEILDVGPLGKGLLPDLRKERKKLCFLPGLNVVTQGCDAWSNGCHLDIWRKSKRIAE